MRSKKIGWNDQWTWFACQSIWLCPTFEQICSKPSLTTSSFRTPSGRWCRSLPKLFLWRSSRERNVSIRPEKGGSINLNSEATYQVNLNGLVPTFPTFLRNVGWWKVDEKSSGEKPPTLAGVFNECKPEKVSKRSPLEAKLQNCFIQTSSEPKKVTSVVSPCRWWRSSIRWRRRPRGPSDTSGRSRRWSLTRSPRSERGSRTRSASSSSGCGSQVLCACKSIIL